MLPTSPHVALSWADSVARGLAGGGIQDVVYVPDNPLAQILAALTSDHPHVRQILATREEEAAGIAAGLYLGGRRPALLMQSSGLGNSANALASLLVAYQIPAVFVLSMRGGAGEWNWAQVPLGRAIRPMLDALGVAHVSVKTPDQAEDAVRTLCGTAFDTRFPVACLLSRRLTTEGGETPRARAAQASDARRIAPHAASGDAAGADAAVTMTRNDATACLAARLRDHAVIVSLGHPAYELFTTCDRPQNFYTWGSMGVTSSIALGVALACPDRRVVAVDGDGSLLMNLGSLATIGAWQPDNLVVVVWDNQQYGTTGGQPTATATGADLAAAGRAMGLHAVRVSAAEEFDKALDEAERAPHARLIVVRVHESTPSGRPPLDCVFIKQRFMRALGVPEAGTEGTYFRR